MSVTTTHPQYQEYQYTWSALRDAYSGSGNVKTAPDVLHRSAGVKLAGTRYLPCPSGMDLATPQGSAQYAAYRDRAIWLGATERAVHGIAEAIARKELQHTAPESLTQQLEDVTLTGIPLSSFAEQVVRETLLMGRCGVLVDFPKPEEDPLTGEILPPPAQSRPYWCLYQAEEMINWRTASSQGKTVLSLVVLRECVEVPQGVWPDEGFFVVKTQVQYRVLRLNEAGYYEVSLWRDTGQALGGQSILAFQDTWMPQAYGQPLPFIPFMFLAPFSLEPAIEKSLLEALVEVNYQYYRHSADYEHGLHLTALPTPYVCFTIPPDDGSGNTLSTLTALPIGSATAWMIPDSTAKVGMLEFQGQGLGSHERAMEADIKNMAALGARLLEGMPLVAETATSVMQRSQGSESPAKSLAKTVSMGLTQALQIHSWWAGLARVPDDPAIYVRLNTDLVSNQLEPAMLKALMELLLNGTIAYHTFYWNLQRGEIARPMVEVEEEQALLEAQEMARPLASLPVAAIPATSNGTTG